MLLKVEQDLSAATVFAEGLEQTQILGRSAVTEEPVRVFSFENPVLLTDDYRIGQLPSGQRGPLNALFASNPRTVEYDDVAVTWSQDKYPDVWGPTIDTVFLARGIKQYLEGVKHFAEIGTASGFLLKYALHHGADLESAIATDINPNAIICAFQSIASESKRDIASILGLSPDASTLGLSGRYDLLVTNPPYIPRPQERHNNPYEGLDVIRKLSQEADDLLEDGGRIVTNISTIAGDGPLEWFTDSGFEVTQHETLRVPLKVYTTAGSFSDNSLAWQQYLRESGNIEEDPAETEGWQFWHNLRIFEITRS
jgi:tRNA1(Val) A37 N6-methylase TrmN6